MLDEISKRISITSSLITELKKKRNVVLLIENILFKYNIKIKDLNIDNIILINEDDLRDILNEIGHKNLDKEILRFNKNKDIIKLYQNISKNKNTVKKPSQYKKAKKKTYELIDNIKEFLRTDENEKIEHINLLEEKLQKYIDTKEKFKNGKLKKPIFDMLEFHEDLNKYGLDVATKAGIKKEIGKQNFSLVIKENSKRNEEEKILNKYLLVLQRKKEKYKKDLKETTEEFISQDIKLSISNAEQVIRDFHKTTKKPFDLIKSSLVALMLENEIKKFQNLLNNNSLTEELKEQTIINCEKILLIKEISQNPEKQQKHKIINENNKTKPKSKTEDHEIVTVIENIVKEEIEVLKNYSDNDTTRLTEISALLDKYALEEESHEKTTLTAAFLAETLRVNLIFFKQLIKNYEKSPKEYEVDYKKKIGELRDYISTYEIVKKRT